MKKELKATYVGDSRYYYLFAIDGGKGLTGTIYIPKGKPVPDMVTIRLRNKAEVEAKQNAVAP